MTPRIKTLTVGVLQTNCYLANDKNGNTIIIDPGDDADYVIETVRQDELTPKLIIATHGHFDHLLAALELKLAYKIPFCMHRLDEFLLKRMDTTAKHFINFDPGPPPPVDIYLKNSELKIDNLIDYSNWKLDVISTPGHTPGSVSLYLPSHNAVFTGDLIFADGSFGGVDHGYSNILELKNSIAKIQHLPKDTLIYPGHGEEFSVRKSMSPQERPQIN